MTATPPWSAIDGLRYGLLGLALAFAALPLYILLPHHYASEFGVPLATLGGLLLGARLLDAFIDPFIGRLTDRLFARSAEAVLTFGAATALALAAGFAALFFPPALPMPQLLAWAAAALVLTYAAYSALSVSHQSWGAMLGGGESQRAAIVAWREGLGLCGVVLASILPAALGLPFTAIAFAGLLGAGCWAWAHARRPRARVRAQAGELWRPWRRPAFRRLIGVFLMNGIASALPATLVLFFVRDRLQAARQYEPYFLGCYFLCAALSVPLWLWTVRRWGLARSWLAGMLAAVGIFACAGLLEPGETTAFLVVCGLSGAALGSDLALPGAMLAGLIGAAGDRGAHEGAYFGWWNFASKLNLALAAGLALPLLDWAGYVPGSRDPSALKALGAAYCLLPCGLKLLAAILHYRAFVRPRSLP